MVYSLESQGTSPLHFQTIEYIIHYYNLDPVSLSFNYKSPLDPSSTMNKGSEAVFPSMSTW